MRGKPNTYKARPVTLFGTVVRWVVSINNVPCLELGTDLKPISKGTKLKVNWDLVNRAVANAR